MYPLYGDPEAVDESERAAKIIQAGLNDEINISKKRTELGKDDVFLLREVTVPIVIVACGFLSNPEDASNLKIKNFKARSPET